MYIDQMEISGFGLYSGLTLNLEQGLNIILGPNEAGKSTCHEFVRFVLYGPPTGSGSRGAPRYEPLAGGEHGGSLELVTLAGQSFRLTRKGRTPNKFRLIDANMEELGPEMLAHVLGQAGPELYNTVFAFSIKELYDLNALDPKQTPDVLCGINFGLGNISISAVLRDLDQQRAKLYAPRASNPALNDLFRELKQVREKLAPLRHNFEEYAALDAQLADMAGENAALRAELDRLRAEQDKFKAAQRLFPLWRERNGLEETLRGLPAPGQDFLADDLARLERLEERQKDHQASASRLRAQLDELEAKIASPFPNPVLLEVDDLLADLGGRRGQYSESRELIPLKKTRLVEVEAKIAAILAGLDQNWSSGQAVSFNFSKKAWLEQLLADLQQSERDAGLAQREKERLRQEAEALAAPENLDSLPASETLRANLRSLREIRDQERDLGHALQMENLSGAERRRTKQYGLLSLGLYCALAGGVPAGFWIAPGPGLGLGLGIMALFVILALAMPKKPDARIMDLQAELAGIAVRKADSCAALSLNDTTDINFPAVEERIARIAKIEQLKEHMSTEAAKLEVNNNSFAGLRLKLRESLADLGINPDCTGAEVKALLERSQELQFLFAEENTLKKDIEDLERHMDDFSNGLGYLVSRTAIDWRLDERGIPDPLATLAKVEAAVRAARDDRLGRQHLERQHAELKPEWERQASAGKTLDAELLELLRHRGVSTGDEFRRAFALWQKIQDTKTRLEQLHKEILSGAGERPEEVLHLLGYISAEKLESQIANLARHIEEQSRLVAERQQQQGKIRQQRDALIDERRFEELRFREGALKQEISEAARSWAMLTLARQAVTEAKAFFEQERQPEVMRTASCWFKTITLGEYIGISPDSEPGALAVLTAQKEPRLVTQLSRGTREQLFLAMRLALIRERGRDSEPLPVLMDDILVNFDPERARAAAAAVLSLAGDHQILFFTCHPHTAKIFADLARKANRSVGTFAIEDGRLRST